MQNHSTTRSPTDALLHEWFVEYNPVYLLSAALVLAGLTLVSCGIDPADAGAQLSLGAVSEAYALALIGGAALLRRLGHRRVAVMLGLFAALYQCDVVLHVERCAYLGTLGIVASLAWVALFHAKLRLLARALGLAASRAALAVPTLGAAVVAALPQVLPWLSIDGRVSVVSLAIFVVAAAALWTSRAIGSDIGFDYRGRRAIHGTWILWAAGAAAHVLYACVSFHVDVVRCVPAALVLATRWARTERWVWAALATALVFALGLDPALVSTTAAMIAVALVLRAFRSPADPASVAPEAPPPAPYRGAPTPLAEVIPALAEPTFTWAERDVRERSLLGALATAHLAAWTSLVPYGIAMPHVVWLDVLLLATCLAWFWARRSPPIALAILPASVHWALQTGTVVPPRTIAEHGAWAIGTGFALLIASLGRVWWRERAVTR